MKSKGNSLRHTQLCVLAIGDAREFAANEYSSWQEMMCSAGFLDTHGGFKKEALEPCFAEYASSSSPSGT